MEVAEPCGSAEAVAMLSAEAWGFLAQPGAPLSLADAARLAADLPRRPAMFLIGPEGGFTPAEEQQALAACWRGLSLGNRILRIETAVVLCGAWAALGEA